MHTERNVSGMKWIYRYYNNRYSILVYSLYIMRMHTVVAPCEVGVDRTDIVIARGAGQGVFVETLLVRDAVRVFHLVGVANEVLCVPLFREHQYFGHYSMAYQQQQWTKE